jgi:BirA family biotin operon repressor/biotin-[acetyl-CoA-carboxylase] ligase
VISDDPNFFRQLAASTRFGRLIHVASCTSTQDLAAADPNRSAAIYWADHQTAGRGRQQRIWDDEPGTDIAATFRCSVAAPSPIALAVGVPLCVLQAAEPLVGRKLRLKWPNDVFCDDRKLAGVLIDGDGNGNYAIGIGINLNRTRFPRELEASATSLALVCGHTFDRAALLLDLAQRLEAMLQALAKCEVGALTEQFRDRLGLLGANVRVRAGQDYEGVIESIDLEHLRLADGQSIPLGIVQSIAPR